VTYAYNKTNDMHYFLKFIFGIELYMFRTVSLSIIRSCSSILIPLASSQHILYVLLCVHSAKFLMMDRETARNM